ncbi:MAG: hypothetical protein R2825_10710 [Saprospiraceae bacterium]
MRNSTVQSYSSLLPGRFSKKSEKDFLHGTGKAVVEGTPIFATYEDHRMAMVAAPLAMFVKQKYLMILWWANLIQRFGTIWKKVERNCLKKLVDD